MNELKFRPSEIVVALDIGTTKVCAIAGRKNQYGLIEVLGMGKVKSEGVSRGVVSNINKTVKAIQDAVDMAEKQCGKKFERVHVGIAGQHIKSIHHHGVLMREDGLDEISKADVDKLIGDMLRLVLPAGDKILHAIPQEFTVDDEQDILDPVGMSGVRLEANFHIITGRVTASRNIQRCVEKIGLEVADLTLEPIASAAAVLTEQEKEAGVALVDIGGGTTDITIFKDGIIRHTAVIPFGGEIITSDIKEGCTVMMDQAEKLKVKFGSALAELVSVNRFITIPGLSGRPQKEISERNLGLIIQARVSEIFDFVMWEIKRSGFERKLVGGLVLTGGGALLNHIEKLAEYNTGLNTRVGVPTDMLAHKYDGKMDSPIYATSVGLLITAINNLPEPEEVEEEVVTPAPVSDEEKKVEQEVIDLADEKEEEPVKKRGIFGTLLEKAKELLESTPDSEF